MRYGLSVINFGRYGDPNVLIELAAGAEAAGWEGLFLWDHLSFAWPNDSGANTGDPWVLLAAVACNTERLVLGTSVTPIPRRRPQVLATQVATLDRLSNGRAVLGAGLGGVEEEFTRFGDVWNRRERARRLDDGLALIQELWRDQRQIPIWIGGHADAALLRAARFDGWAHGGLFDERGEQAVPVSSIADAVSRLRAVRGDLDGFDVVVGGNSAPSDPLPSECEAAGATWWLEGIYGFRGSQGAMLDRVAAGPPRAVSGRRAL
jgi:alkanesulfonate monooxygenase SsuD/methylene tetrahydromethanopterin reductase-like flavin-dependent oxidoreductase (luciferase family)